MAEVLMAEVKQGVEYRHTWRGAISCDTCDARIEGKDLSTEADLVRIDLAAMEARAIRAESDRERLLAVQDAVVRTIGRDMFLGIVEATGQ